MKIKVLLILFIFTVFSSCMKDEIVTDKFISEVSTKTGIPTFKTLDEFNVAVNKTNSMTNEELSNYEKTMGYKSFGRICDEFYYSINPDTFKSKGEIESFVTNNSKFLVFDTDYTGDTYCLPREYDNKARYLLNEDKMYVIGDFVFKKFEKAIVSTEVLNISKLYKLETAGEAQGNPIFNVQKISNETTSSKKEQYEDDDTVGSYRLKLFIQTEIFHYTLPWKVETHRETEYKITNYKRSLVFWFQKKMLTNYEIDLISYDERSQVYRYVSGSGTNVYDDVIAYSDEYFLADGLTWGYVPYFGNYYATAINEHGCTVTFQPQFKK